MSVHQAEDNLGISQGSCPRCSSLGLRGTERSSVRGFYDELPRHSKKRKNDANQRNTSDIYHQYLGKYSEPQSIFRVQQGKIVQDSEIGWRKIIFLPFSKAWSGVLSWLLITNVHLTVHHTLFGNPDVVPRVVRVLTWVFYFLDSVCLLAHKTYKSIATTRTYMPYSWKVIIFQVLSSLPPNRTLLELYIGQTAPDSLEYKYKLLYFLCSFVQLSRVLIYIKSLGESVLFKRVQIIIYKYITLLFIGSATVIALSKLVLDFDGELTRTLEEYMKPNKLTNAKAYSSVALYVLQLTIGRFYFPVTLVSERQITAVFVCFYIIFCVTYTGIIAYLVFAEVYSVHRFIVFSKYLKTCKKHLRNMNAGVAVEKAVTAFNSSMWERWGGVQYEPFFDIIHDGLKGDVNLDIHWDTLQHSHMFRNISFNLKRALSLSIHSVFTDKDDLIFKKGTVKHALLYLSSGSIEVMTDLGFTPLLPLSTGTALGEASTVLPFLATTDLRCSSMGELRRLTSHHLFLTLLHYPWETRSIRYQCFERIAEAAFLLKLGKKLARVYQLDRLFNLPRVVPIRWVKARWYELADYQEKLRNDPSLSPTKIAHQVNINITRTSRFLDLYVLTSDYQANEEKFCIQCKFPYVLDPDSSFLLLWNRLITTFILIDAFILPYFIAFVRTISSRLERYLLTTMIFYLLDMYILFITAIIPNTGRTISKPMEIFQARMMRLKDIIEVFAAIPYAHLIWLVLDSERVYQYLLLFRLLKCGRLRRSIIKYETSSITVDIVKVRIVRHCCSLFIAVYWVASLLYIVTCPLECHPDGWYMQAFVQQPHLKKLKDEPFPLSILFSISLLICNRLIMIKTNVLIEYAIITFVLVCATFYAIHLVTQLTSTYFNTNYFENVYRLLIKELNDFIEKRNIPIILAKRIREFLDISWSHNYAANLLFPRAMVFKASKTLEIQSLHLVYEMLRAQHLFSAYSNESEYVQKFTDAIAVKTESFVLPSLLKIVAGKTLPTGLNIIVKGHCRMISHVEGDAKKHPLGTIIGPGACLNLLEILYDIPSCVTIFTLTPTHVIHIKRTDFKEILRKHMTIEKELEVIKSQYTHPFELGQTLSDEEIEVPAVKPISFSVYNEKISFGIFAFGYPFPWCVHPNSKTFIFYETFRCSMIVAGIVYFTSYYTLWKGYYPSSCLIIAQLFDAFTTIDIFFRFHVGYYSKENNLVSHLPRAAKHYLLTSFIVDAISAIPAYIFLDPILRTAPLKTWLALTTIKCIPAYRVIGWFKFHYQQGPAAVTATFVWFTWIVFILVFHAILGNRLAMSICDFHYTDTGLQVSEPAWTLPHGLMPIDTAESVVAHSMLLITEMFVSVSCQSPLVSSTELLWALGVIPLVGYLTRMTVSSFIGSIIIGHVEDTTIQRDNVNTTLAIVTRDLQLWSVPPQFKERFTHYCSNAWARSMSTILDRAVPQFHSSVSVLLHMHLHHASIRQSPILAEVPQAVVKELAIHVKEIYLIRGTHILEHSSLNSTVFIVTRGWIKIRVAQMLTILSGPGTIFGCLSKFGSTRQSCSFQVIQHTDLLSIDSKQFYDALKADEKVYQTVTLLAEPNREYFLGQSYKIISSTSETNLDTEFALKKRKFTRENRIIVWMEGILSYIVPLLTIIFLFAHISLPHKTSMYYFFWVLDAISILKLLIATTVPFSDTNTGYIISSPRTLAKIYFYNAEMIRDVVSILPLDLLWYDDEGINYLLANRLLRLHTLWKYVKTTRNTVELNKIYIMGDILVFPLVGIFVVSVLWTLCFCQDGCLIYPRGNSSELARTEEYQSLAITIMFIVNLLVGCKQNLNVIPSTFLEACSTIILLHLLFLTRITMYGKLTELVQSFEWLKHVYENKVTRVVTFLSQRSQSEILSKSLMTHFKNLWSTHSGEYMPSFLTTGVPTCLRKEIMYIMYGQAIKDIVLFESAHPAFLKELCGKLERQVCFPGETIVASGEVTNSFFIVFSGRVERRQMNEETKLEETESLVFQGETFGTLQGFYREVPHGFGYKASSEVVLLRLRSYSWTDVMATFPLDTKRIFYKVFHSPVVHYLIRKNVAGKYVKRKKLIE